jgi:hypothetical protein
MSRRQLTLLVVALTSFVITACAQPTAPRRADTGCDVVSMGTSGHC